MVDYVKKMKRLQEIYSSFPPTKCKVSCGDWCCSKIEKLFDENGNYMSLPMVYSIEFLSILNYLKSQYSEEELHALLDFEKKKPMCVFRDSQNNACTVHKVHPFSCRVYGHKVPPVFWGVETTEENAANIFCENMEVLDEQKAETFRAAYPGYWNELANLSGDFSLFSEKKQAVMMAYAGIPDIKVLGFLEFYYLVNLTDEEFAEKFPAFWDVYSQLM